MRLLAWTPLLLGAVLGVQACGSAAPNGGTPPDGSFGQDRDADPDAKQVATPSQPSAVLVNGLVKGVAAADLTLTDVRICLPGANYPLPDDRAMPLANYPGVGVGQGIDLGPVSPTNGMLTVDVFNASDLQYDATWQQQRQTCSQITCSTGAACKKHVELQVPVDGQAVNLLVLVDAAQGVEVRQATLDGKYSGTPGAVSVQVANFSGWHDGQEVNANFGQTNHSGNVTPIANPLAPSQASTPTTTVPVPDLDYEGYGVWFTQTTGGQTADTFGQSLGSIQWASNPTTAPTSFYDVRKNFALVLVGNPSDTLLMTNNRAPTFDGRALHIVAVPFEGSP